MTSRGHPARRPARRDALMAWLAGLSDREIAVFVVVALIAWTSAVVKFTLLVAGCAS